MNTEKPTPPDGHELKRGHSLPCPVPEGTQVWDDAGDPSVWRITKPEQDIYFNEWWYAVPVQKAEPEIFEGFIRGPVNYIHGTDPKKKSSEDKPQLQLIPPALNVETSKALARGGVKHGPWNWRENKVEIMTYLGAMKRHIDLVLNGEDIDADTGAHHLGCVAAGCGIVLDARQYGTLVDNRPPPMQTA